MDELKKPTDNTKTSDSAKRCFICNRPKRDLIPSELIRPAIVQIILNQYPGWTESSYICHEDLNIAKSKYMESILEEEKGKLSHVEKQVVRSMKKHEILAENINQQFEKELTIGEKVSDKVAAFGGSWKFIITFISIMMVWIIINAFILIKRPFDPYPFILLNLILSCLAALQAPIIMMSQNRQEDKDRMRSENDYKTNLKAELEIRHLNEKMDHLLSYQWQRLLEIQQLQLDMIEDLAEQNREKTVDRVRI